MPLRNHREQTWIEGANMSAAIRLLIYLVVSSSSQYCSIQKTGELAITNRIITWNSPVNTLRLETQVKTIKEELEIENSQYQRYSFTKHDKHFKIEVPKETSSLTLARGKCLEMEARSITVEEILEAKLNERFSKLDSINFIMKTANKTKCNTSGREEQADCLKQIEQLAAAYRLKTNASEMEQFLNKHKLGMLTVQGQQLVLTTGTKTILPCISERTNKTRPAKWTILKTNYLNPKVKKVEKLLKLVQNTMGTENNKRTKRSLFSSIFNLASASETESLRKALKTELNNQKQTNKAMAELLRNQVKAAEALNKEDEILFRLEKEEANLENKVENMKDFLEKAFTNSSEITSRLTQDVMAILKTITINERLNNIGEQLKTILDILHCPAGNCRRILEDIMRMEEIGEPKTYDMIAKLVTVKHTKGDIEVRLHNIAISDQVFTIKCIPFSEGNKTMKLEYNNEVAMGTRGFFIPKGNCMREADIILCPEEPIYHKDMCLRDLIINSSQTRCEEKLREDSETMQDFISNGHELQIYTRVTDKMKMKTKSFQFQTQMKEGINIYSLLKKEDYLIETSYISFQVKNHVQDKILTNENNLDNMFSQDTEKEDELTSDNIIIDLRELENIETPEEMPKVQRRPTFETPANNLPHPAIVYLSTPSESWYVWMIIGGLLTTAAGAIVYCKCKRTCLFKMRNQDKEEIELGGVRESESLIHSRPKYTEMVVNNLGFTKEITATVSGQTYYWDGASWRDEDGVLQANFREPPSYLQAELFSYREGCVIGEKDSKPYIHLKHFPETNFNKVRNVFEITMNNKTRPLPHYCAPKPSMEMLQKHTRAVLEAQKLNLNSPTKSDKPTTTKETTYETMN